MNRNQSEILTHKLLLFHAIITHIYDNHINFEVSLHFRWIWPNVWRLEALCYPETVCGVVLIKTNLPTGGDWKKQTILLVRVKISPHTNKDSGGSHKTNCRILPLRGPLRSSPLTLTITQIPGKTPTNQELRSLGEKCVL